MKRLQLIGCTALLLLTLFVSCDNDGEQYEASLENTVYPLHSGNWWVYQASFYTNGELLEHWFYDGRTKLEILGVDEYTPGESAFHLIQYFVSPYVTPIDTGHSWYRLESNGLYNYAYRNAGAGDPVDPKNGQAMRNLVSLMPGTSRFSVANDSTYIEETPLLALPRPLNQGFRWYYRSAAMGPWVIEKTILAPETIRIMDQDMRSVAIFTEGDPTRDGEPDYTLIDNYNEIGLLRREFNAVQDLTDEYGNYIQTDTVKFVYELIDYHLNN